MTEHVEPKPEFRTVPSESALMCPDGRHQRPFIVFVSLRSQALVQPGD
jgi:hypothetical protein